MTALPKPPRRAPADRKPLRRSRVAKKPKHSKKKLRQEADKLWSAIIKRPGRCHLCGSTERLQAAHLISRRYHATRWRLDNGWPLCSRDHVRYTYRPLEWDALLDERLGPLHQELRRAALAGVVDVDGALATLRAHA